MFIECVKNHNTEYLRLVDARTFSVNGVRKHQRYVVRNIGPLSRYDDGLADYISCSSKIRSASRLISISSKS